MVDRIELAIARQKIHTHTQLKCIFKCPMISFLWQLFTQTLSPNILSAPESYDASWLIEIIRDIDYHAVWLAVLVDCIGALCMTYMHAHCYRFLVCARVSIANVCAFFRSLLFFWAINLVNPRIQNSNRNTSRPLKPPVTPRRGNRK